MESIINYGDGIAAIDSGFIRPRLAAVHCIIEEDHVALVDTATNPSSIKVLAALAAHGVRPTQVKTGFCLPTSISTMLARREFWRVFYLTREWLCINGERATWLIHHG